MYNRIDLHLRRSLKAGLVAATPWLALVFALSLLALYLQPLFLVALVPAAAGVWRRWQQCGNLTHPHAIVRMTVRDNLLIATLRNQRELPVTVTGASRLTAGLAVLGLRHGGRRWPCPVVLCTPGNATQDDFRRLRVWLRLASHDQVPSPLPVTVSGALKQRLSLSRSR